MIGFIFVPVILFGLFLASAENAAPGVTYETTLALAEVYSTPQLPQQVAAITSRR